MRGEHYEQSKQLLIYKIPDDTIDNGSDSKLQSVPCPVRLAGFFFVSHDRSEWEEAVLEQALYYGEGAYWGEDSPETQVMALVVLDEFPTEVRNLLLPRNARQLTAMADNQQDSRRQR